MENETPRGHVPAGIQTPNGFLQKVCLHCIHDGIDGIYCCHCQPLPAHHEPPRMTIEDLVAPYMERMEMFSYDRAAAIIGISERSLHRLMETHQVPFVNFGRKHMITGLNVQRAKQIHQTNVDNNKAHGGGRTKGSAWHSYKAH